MVDLGQRLKDLRTGKGLTQLQVAQRIGISKAMVSSYELSARQPSYDVLIKLAALFSVSTDYLLGIERGRLLNTDGLSENDVALVAQLIESLKK